jgi:glycosyltransferase involved in cell wall biosynthesis
MNQFIQSHGYSNCVHVISDISQEQLRAIYSDALMFIFPSLFEGFGWPVSEAQACGCPVFASNIEPMPEVGGNGAKYFNPLFPAEAAEIIELSNLQEMSVAGFLNVSRFKRDVMISNIILELDKE